MYLLNDAGEKIQVGAKSVFEIVLVEGLREIRVYARGGNKPRHVSWHYGKPSAEQALADIEVAIRRRQKEFKVLR